MFTGAPDLHEQTFKTEGVGKQSQCQQMTVQTVHFTPGGTQEFCPRRNFNAHHFLQSHAVGGAVNEGTDSADMFYQERILLKIFLFRQTFQSAVHVSDDRNNGCYLFIDNFKTQLKGFRQNRVLRAERYDNTHFAASSFWTSPAAGLAFGASTAVTFTPGT